MPPPPPAAPPQPAFMPPPPPAAPPPAYKPAGSGGLKVTPASPVAAQPSPVTLTRSGTLPAFGGVATWGQAATLPPSAPEAGTAVVGGPAAAPPSRPAVLQDRPATSPVAGDVAETATAIGAIIREIRRAMKARQMYVHIENHGEDQLRALFARLQGVLEDVGDVSLRVEVSSLLWSDVEVFDDDARDINFGYSLYRAGVRILVFRPSLTWDEFLSFWTVVAEDLADVSGEDLLTRLWRQGYDGVAWVAQTQLDDIDEVEDLARLLTRTASGAQVQHASDALIEQHGPALRALLEGFAQQATAHGPGVLPVVSRAIEADDLAERARVMASAASTLLDITQLQSFPEAGEFLADGFEQMATAMLSESSAAEVGALAERAFDGIATNTGTVQEDALRLALVGMTRALRSPHSVLRLRAQCEDGTLSVSGFSALVRLLAADGSQGLLTLLDGKLPVAARVVVLQALARSAPSEAVHIARRLKSADERLACELLDVIVLLNMPRRVMLCEPALSHPSPLVRRHTLAVIQRCDESADVVTLLVRLLDRSQDPGERLQLIDALARADCAEGERALTAHVKREEIDKREQQATWAALLGGGSLTVLALAERVARQSTRGLLGMAKDESLKASLVEALGQHSDVRNMKVLAIVVQEESLSSRALHRRAQEVLTAIRARFLDGGHG
jgi:hypothetical protein